MSDDVRNAAFIGASINKGLGAFPTAKKKKKTAKPKVAKTAADTAATTSEPTVSKPALEAPSEPIFVKSERVNTSSSSPKEIGFNPNRGRQFNG